MNVVQRYLIEEFVEEYHARRMGRRELMRRALLTMGGVAAAAAALRHAERALAANASLRVGRVGSWPGALSAQGQPDRVAGTEPPPVVTDAFVVQPDDPAIGTELASVPGEAGAIRAYLARPSAPGRYPGVVVIHENRGLIEPNLDIGRRFAKLGYVAIVPDLLSRVGGTEQFANDPQAAAGALSRLGADAMAADGNAAAAFLLSHPAVSGAVGATGYCLGGGVVWAMGFRNPDLRAVVPYYGFNPPVDEAPNLRGAALGIFAELDTRITATGEELAARLQELGKTFEIWIAPNAGHAFFNNTNAGSYNPDAAREAWLRTIAWFDRFLGGGPATPRALPATGDGSLEDE